MAEKRWPFSLQIRDRTFYHICTNITYYLTIDKKFLAVSLFFNQLIGISLIVHNGD